MNELISKILLFNNKYLYFDEENHTYYLKGKMIQSVSRLLDKLKSQEELDKFNSVEFQEFLKPYAEFGTFIHTQTERLDKGFVLEDIEYNEKELTAMNNYKNHISTLRDQGYELLVIELPMYSKKFNAFGTIDRLFYNKETNKILLADIKTGSTRDSHWYQQLTYKAILEEWGIKVDDIALISLKLKNKIPLFSTLKEDKQTDLILEWSQLEGE